MRSPLKIRLALDAETTASLTYDVQVSDGVTDVQTSITIDINPISEFAPVFAVTGPFSVPEKLYCWYGSWLGHGNR